MAVGHEAEMANTVEAIGQCVQQEATNELVWCQPHDFDSAVVAIVLPGKGHMIVVKANKAAVGNGNAVGVAAQTGQNLDRSAKRLFGIDDPVDAVHGRYLVSKGGGIGQRGKVVEKRQFARVKTGLQLFQKQPPEQFCQRLDRKEEALAARNPPGRTRRQATAGHDAMEMSGQMLRIFRGWWVSA